MSCDIVLIATILFVTDNVFNRYEFEEKKHQPYPRSEHLGKPISFTREYN